MTFRTRKGTAPQQGKRAGTPVVSPMNIALIGCGNIASIIARKARNVRIVAVYDADEQRKNTFAAQIGAHASPDLASLLEEDVALVVEAASPSAVRQTAQHVIKAGKDLMVMSVGGLVDPVFRSQLIGLAGEHNRRIYIPSGAIGGLDAISAARVGRIDSITLETRKPPGSLGLTVASETVVFEGTPQEAIARYPRNINVAVTLSIIGGDDRVRVTIIADPATRNNTHRITVRGEVGTLAFEFANEPSPNQATSLLAGYSAVALLERIAQPLHF